MYGWPLDTREFPNMIGSIACHSLKEGAAEYAGVEVSAAREEAAQLKAAQILEDKADE